MKKRTVTSEKIRDFEFFLRDDEKSKATIEKYVRDVKHFMAYAGGRNVDKALILSYKTKLAADYAVTSANSMLASLNTFFRYSGWHDCCVKQFRVQKKAFCSESKELTKEEYVRLVRSAISKGDEKLALIIETICCTGVRVSELEFVTVEALNEGEVTVNCKGKTRTVFIVKGLCTKLRKYADNENVKSGPVFVTRTGNPVNRSNIWRKMKSLCLDTGICPEKVFPHNLRHLFARTFYDIEKDISKLADVLGHTNINTTRIYTITTGTEHKKKMENMRLVI